MLLATLIALGCKAPFTHDRHDLAGPRIAAVGAVAGVARAALWSGLGPWHEESPSLEWTLDGAYLGEGYDVAAGEAGLLGLRATFPGGEAREAEVAVGEAPGALTLSREAVILEDLSLEARREVEGEPVEASVAAGEAARLTVSGADGREARWMSAGGALLELDEDTVDFLAEDVELEDGETVGREPLDPGVYPGLVLVIDGAGGNGWLWLDAAVGVSEPLVRHQGRLIPADAAGSAGLIAATLAADDASGVALEDTEAVADLSQQDALACAPPGQAFDLAWIAEGRCPRPEVLGARVVLEVW